jgi:hypothetical protein
MAMKLGALLVREGVVSPEQLDEALKLQTLYGGRLGTNLVELGYIDVDVLAQWLSKQTGFPAATTAMLEATPSELLHLLPSDLAERYECFPLKKESRKLTVAMVNPADLAGTDALSFKTGLRIVPYVVPEVQIQLLLERRYGLKPNVRYIRLTGKTKDAAIPAGIRREKPAPPPPVTPEMPTLPPEPAEEAVEPMSVPPAWPTPTPQGAGWTTPPLTSPLPAWSSPPPPSMASGTMVWGKAPLSIPPPAPTNVPRATTDEWLRATETLRNAPTTIPPPPPIATPATLKPVMSLSEAASLLDAAHSRDAIGEVLVQFATNRLDGALVLLVRENMAVGWKGGGVGIDRTLVDFVMLPLTVPSVFQDAVQQRKTIGGPFPESTLRTQFCTALRRPVPASILVIPIVLRQQVVNLIYADRLSETDALEVGAPLVEFAGLVSSAYERVLRESRTRH